MSELLRRHTSTRMVATTLDSLERTSRDAAQAAEKVMDAVIEEAGALTFFGLTQVSDSAARKFVEFGLWTRGHGGFPATFGRKVVVYGALGALGASLLYRLGAVDGALRRLAERACSDALGTRVTIRSLCCALARGEVTVRGLRVDAWPRGDDDAAPPPGPALSVGSFTVGWSSSLVARAFRRRDEAAAPFRLDALEVEAVDLRLHREADGALNWASAHAAVRARRASSHVLELHTTSSSEETSDDDAPPVSRFLLPLEDSSSEGEPSDAEAKSPRPGAYGARWWRKRDVDRIAQACGASYAATKKALERTARRVAPPDGAVREATRALRRAKARAVARADAFERWACDHAKDVLRHVVVNLAHNLSARAHHPVPRAAPASDDDEPPPAVDAAPEPDRALFVVGSIGVRDFTLELYDCPVTLDRCFVGEADLVLDDAILEQYGARPRGDCRAFTAPEIGLAFAEKLIETLLVDHPTLALNLAAALSRDLVARKSNASRPLKRRFLAHRRAAKKRKKREAADAGGDAPKGWLAWLRGA